MKKIFKLLFIGSTLFASQAFSQQDSTAKSDASPSVQEKLSDLKGKIDGLEEDYLGTKPTVEKLSKIKISGYLQAQVRYAHDTTGQLKSDLTNNYDIGEFQGGKFPALTQSVFQLRRARIKVGYETALTQMAIQLDCLPFTTGYAASPIVQDSTKKVTSSKSAFLSGGGIAIKEASLRFAEPWLKSFAIKAGVFDRPFGYETPLSSSSRESPELSRMIQTLFPGEQDLGASIEYTPAGNLPLAAQCFNLKAGCFAGNGVNVEFDDIRDFIGRVGFSIPLVSANLGIDGGFSTYLGNIRNRSDSLYEVKDNAWTGTGKQKWSYVGRQYFGEDLELFYGNIPFFGGICLRGELISGKQPGTSSTSVSQKSDQASTDPVYLRNFFGGSATAVLNIDPIHCQLVGKFDAYDPNTDLSGTDIKNTTDMKFTTLGGGLIYHWDENVKLTAYYDKVTNEKINKAPFNADVNDNVFTFRIQYKF